MKEPTNEQIKEFWEWCGLQVRAVDYGRDSWVEWQDPKDIFISRHTPPIDLNNLFKYAVPKLGVGLDYIQFKFRKEGWLCVIRGVGLEKRAFYYEDPALALFWAIWEVIK